MMAFPANSRSLREQVHHRCARQSAISSRQSRQCAARYRLAATFRCPRQPRFAEGRRRPVGHLHHFSLAVDTNECNNFYDEILRNSSSHSERVTRVRSSVLQMKTDSIIRRLATKAMRATPAGQVKVAVDNLAENLNRRLDRLQEAADNQQHDVNKRLDKLIEAVTNQSTAANRRLDKLIAATGGHAPAGTASHPPSDGSPKSKIRANPEWLNAKSPDPTPLPRWSGEMNSTKPLNGSRHVIPTNTLHHHQPLLDALEPWRGRVPAGYLADFLGILTDANFRAQFGVDPAQAGGAYVTTEMPPIQGCNGEWWFEVINWLEAAREARDRYVMITLGASYGAQAVGAYRALQIVNPMPCKLVAVEPVPENCLWVRKHFKDNGIDPESHWLVQAAISNVNEPVFFPIGAPGSGANNCMSTDTPEERNELANQLIAQGEAADVLRSLMVHNTTGIMKDLLPGQALTGEIELVSAITLHDLLSPFDMIDYVEADIQQSEIRVFPPFLDLLRKKVRRIHIGTHGVDTHLSLHTAFSDHGWEIVFSYPPNGSYDSELGRFDLNDGVLTVRNPDL